MGITYVQGQVKGPSKKQKTVKFLIDSGVTYSLLPKKIWKEIGLKPKRKMSFTLADGSTSGQSGIRDVYRSSAGPGSYTGGFGRRKRSGTIRSSNFRNSWIGF